jgi:hypothetical protein
MNLPSHNEVYYSKDGRLKSAISIIGQTIFIEFYKDDIMLELQECKDHNMHYAHDMAENYCAGIFRIDNKFL